jgi:hypothetical protein
MQENGFDDIIKAKVAKLWRKLQGEKSMAKESLTVYLMPSMLREMWKLTSEMFCNHRCTQHKQDKIRTCRIT